MTDTTTTYGAPSAGAHPTASEDAHTIMINRVSWGAIFAGVVVALVVQVLLTLLGVGIGAATLIVGGTFRGIAGAVGGISQAATEVAGPMLQDANPLDVLERGVEATGTDPEALNTAAMNAMRRLAMADEAGAADARTEAAQALSEARGIPLPEAEQQVAQLEQQYRETVEQAQQTATEAADAAASAVSTGALTGFVALLLAAIAGWLGGRSGVVHPVYADRIVPSRRAI